MDRYIVGVSGASGIILTRRCIEALVSLGYGIELVMSPSSLYTASLELGREFATPTKFIQKFPPEIQKGINLHPFNDVGCAISSGSYPVSGMVIIPCSMASVAAISMGLGDNVLRRAADVSLKERRPLIVVPREAPLSEIHLENLLKLSRLGATIIPPIPAWYTNPRTLLDIENFIVGKVLDALHIEHQLYPRWKCTEVSEEGKDESSDGR